MKRIVKYLPLLAVLMLGTMTACQDESVIGGSLTPNEVSITIDTMTNLNYNAKSEVEPKFDARLQSKMLGRLSVKEYGNLDCSFVSEMMCANKLTIPDSIPVSDVDSMVLVLGIARGSLIGDSLAPQQLKVYQLTKQLPSDIDNNFDPTGYYDAKNPLGIKSYSLSALGQNDSIFKIQSSVSVRIKMPNDKEMAQKLVNAYRTNPSVFEWPREFMDKYKAYGLYVDQNFGSGCVGVITSVSFYTYWNYPKWVSKKTDKKDANDKYICELVKTTARDSVCLLASKPEMLSSNNVVYRPSQNIINMANSGKNIITTPGGYRVDFTFPAQQIIDSYSKKGLTTISALSFNVPAKEVKNDYEIGTAPYLLMVKRSERDKFFAEHKLPDSKVAFYAAYNSTTKSYTFTGMRDYIKTLVDAGEIKKEDVEFSFIPVWITTETVQSNYSSSVTYVVGCTNYIGRPTMTELDIENAQVVFVYSHQEL